MMLPLVHRQQLPLRHQIQIGQKIASQEQVAALYLPFDEIDNENFDDAIVNKLRRIDDRLLKARQRQTEIRVLQRVNNFTGHYGIHFESIERIRCELVVHWETQV